MRSAASKVMWVGRATVFMVALAVILALVFGVATTALGADGNPFLLGKKNVASAISTLVKQGTGPALKLQVGAGQPPLAVNSTARVANLNAATAGRADSAASADSATNATNAQNAANADTLDNRDSNSFADATHNHAGEAITSGTVAEARIDPSVARDAEVMDTVKANDGANSGLDADRLDGLTSTDFAAANHRHSTTIGSFAGGVSTIAGLSNAWVFAGPTTQMTVSSGQRLTGSAVGVVALNPGTAAQQVNVGLCFQPSGGGAINNFVGTNDTRIQIGDRKDTIAAAASVAPAAGTYNVGFCVMNIGPATLSNNDWVNGWVMVTNN